MASVNRRLQALEDRMFVPKGEREERKRREFLRRMTDAELLSYEEALESPPEEYPPILRRVDELMEEVRREGNHQGAAE